VQIVLEHVHNLDRAEEVIHTLLLPFLDPE
jgi:hypothetical protein